MDIWPAPASTVLVAGAVRAAQTIRADAADDYWPAINPQRNTRRSPRLMINFYKKRQHFASSTAVTDRLRFVCLAAP